MNFSINQQLVSGYFIVYVNNQAQICKIMKKKKKSINKLKRMKGPVDM